MQTKVINQDPVIFIHDKFISKKESTVLIKLAKNKLVRAKVIDKEFNEKLSKGRTNKTSHFSSNHPSFISIRDKILDTFHLSEDDLTPFQILCYSKGEEYVSHLDFFSSKALKNDKEKQRMCTFLVYLNEDFKGGSISFPLLDIEFKGKTGDLLGFNNCFGETNYGHPKSLHRSKVVEKGTKWALLFWTSKLASF